MGTARRAKILIALTAATLALAACGNNPNPRLLNARQGRTPDEFLILPTKPLESPPDMKALPVPTPGGSNLADHVPDVEAAVALGGKASAMEVTGVSRADGALIASAGRYGVQSDIRQQLAAEDLTFRQKHQGRPLERLFAVNVYFKSYRPYELDQYAELARLRRLGIQTAQVPPDPVKHPKKK